jgi:dTDP-4-dehydrorhamnose reductase
MPHTVKNVLVTGANGQLGNELRVAKSFTNKDNYFFTDIAELDITNEETIRNFVQLNNIDIIINCAAYTNVENAETHEFNAELINSISVKYLAEIMKEVNGTLIHVSTDYVFDGTSNIPLNENHVTNPIGVYGKTKMNGENYIKNSGCNYIILRTSWLYSEFGNNFCKTIRNLISKKEEINVVFDQCGTPTYAYDLAHAIIEIIEQRLYEGNNGIYNYSNEGVTSWYDFAKMIAYFSNNVTCNIKPCYSSEFNSVVKRPSYSVLDKKVFKETFDIKIPYWVDSLKLCIDKLNI